MPLPLSLVVKYRSKMRAQVLGRNAHARVLDVDLDPAPAARRGTRSCSVPPSGIAWQALSARFSSACCSMPGSALISRQARRALRSCTVMPRRSASGADIDDDVADERRELHRLQLQLVGPRELQEAVDDLVEAPDLARDDVRRACVRSSVAPDRQPVPPGTVIGSRTAAELLLQQLEVNRHRVQRVLHFVRHAGHQPAERGELARVVQRRVHLAEVAEVARHEHRAEEPAVRVLDRVAHQQALGGLRIGFAGARAASTPVPATSGPPARARRAGARVLSAGSVSDGSTDRPTGRSAGSSARIAALENISSPSGENSATASSRLSMTDSNSVAVDADAAGSALSRTADSCALTASNELPRSLNSSPGQIER